MSGELTRHATAHPERVFSLDDLARELGHLRRDSAVGMGKVRISLDDLVRRTRLPRSTIHTYISGRSAPPPDALDAIVDAMGATKAERAAWQDALDRVLDSYHKSPATRAPAATPRQLPPVPHPFVGRAFEHVWLSAHLDRRGDLGSLVVVCGQGGVGKTSLVAAWAGAHVDSYPDGVIHLDLQGYSGQQPLTTSRVLQTLLMALGTPPANLPAGGEDLAALYRSVLAQRRLLLLLDNARDAAQVLPLLPGATRSDVIVTSRDELAFLSVRSGAERLIVEPLPDADARGFFGTGELNPDDVTEVLRHCGGLPLALSIASERIERASSLAGLLEELGDEPVLDVLSADSAPGGSVRDIIMWSYECLAREERATMRRLAAVPGPRIDLGAATALLGTTRSRARRRLDALVRQSLLSAAGDDTWTRHDLVTAFATEVLLAEESREARQELTGRLLTHYADLALSVLAEPERALLGAIEPSDLTGARDRADASRRLFDAQDVIDSLTRNVDGPRLAQLAYSLIERVVMAADERGKASGPSPSSRPASSSPPSAAIVSPRQS